MPQSSSSPTRSRQLSARSQRENIQTHTNSPAGVSCEGVAAASLTPPVWQSLTILHSIVDPGDRDRITMRDSVPLSAGQTRLYQLLVRGQ